MYALLFNIGAKKQGHTELIIRGIINQNVSKVLLSTIDDLQTLLLARMNFLEHDELSTE
jgi:hypothetical protein